MSGIDMNSKCFSCWTNCMLKGKVFQLGEYYWLRTVRAGVRNLSEDMKGDKKESRSRVSLYGGITLKEDERRKNWHKGLGPEPVHIRGSGRAVGSFLIMYTSEM